MVHRLENEAPMKREPNEAAQTTPGLTFNVSPKLRTMVSSRLLLAFSMLWLAPQLLAKSEEHAVIVHAPLSDKNFGSKADFDHYVAVEEKLIAAIEGSKAGEYDGNEVGQGEFVFYMYGSDADRLFQVVERILREDVRTSQGYAIVRYGSPGAKERRVELSNPKKVSSFRFAVRPASSRGAGSNPVSTRRG